MRRLALALLLAAAAAPLRAAEVAAELSASEIALGDQVVLSVTIEGAGAGRPRLPPLPDFEVYESGTSQSYSIINGRMSARVVYTFALAPRRAGRLTIPSFEVPGAGATPPLELSVAAPGAPPPGSAPPRAAHPTPPGPAPVAPGAAARPRGPDAFVTARLDKERVLVNEQATLIVRFHAAVPLFGEPRYEAPKLTGVLAEDLGGESRGTTVVDGRTYGYSELRTALFPVQAGRAAIGPATVTVALPQPLSTGDDFFDRVFGTMAAPQTRVLRTEPLALTAVAPPAPVPAGFTGVVGRLRVGAAVDRAKLKAGEAATLTVTVAGTGNLKALPEPARPANPAVRFFPAESQFTPSVEGGRAGGTKVFRAVFVPRVSGPLTLPPPEFVYYDPDARAYATARGPALKLEVAPGDPAAIAAAGTPGVTSVAEDAGYLKPPSEPGPLAALARFGAAGPWHALPLLVLAGAAGAAWRRRAAESDPRARRRREARGRARARLEAGRLSEALAGYLADALDAPPGLTLKSARERLAAARVPEELAGRVKTMWEELDLLRFAPADAGPAESARLAGELARLLDALEEALPR